MPKIMSPNTHTTRTSATAITDALNSTRFAYDSRGNITTITDAKGNITTYEYDILNRLIRVQTLEAA